MANDLQLFGPRFMFGPEGTPDPSGPTEIERTLGAYEIEPATTPDATGPTEIQISPARYALDSVGPPDPLSLADTQILPGEFSVSPPGPVVVIDSPDVQIFSGVSLDTDPSEVEFEAARPNDPGVIFLPPLIIPPFDDTVPLTNIQPGGKGLTFLFLPFINVPPATGQLGNDFIITEPAEDTFFAPLTPAGDAVFFPPPIINIDG